MLSESHTLINMTSILTLPSHMTGFLHELGTQSGIYRSHSSRSQRGELS